MRTDSVYWACSVEAPWSWRKCWTSRQRDITWLRTCHCQLAHLHTILALVPVCWEEKTSTEQQTCNFDQQLNPYPCDHHTLLLSQLLGIQQFTSFLQCCKCIYSLREEEIRWLLDCSRKTHFSCSLLPGGVRLVDGGLRSLLNKKSRHRIDTWYPAFLFPSFLVTGKKFWGFFLKGKKRRPGFPGILLVE